MSDPVGVPVSPLVDLLENLNELNLRDHDDLRSFVDELPTVMIDAMNKCGIDPNSDVTLAVAIIASWLIEESIGKANATVKRFVRQNLANVDADKITNAKAALNYVRTSNDW